MQARSENKALKKAAPVRLKLLGKRASICSSYREAIITDSRLGRRYKLRLVGDNFSNKTGHQAGQYVDEALDKSYGAVTTAVLNEFLVHSRPL